MITLDQIKLLDSKVQNAIEEIKQLRSENKRLKNKLDDYHGRIQELEILIANFKSDQNEIEQGILNTLKELDGIENDLIEQKTSNEGFTKPVKQIINQKILQNSTVEPSSEQNNNLNINIISQNKKSSQELDIF